MGNNSESMTNSNVELYIFKVTAKIRLRSYESLCYFKVLEHGNKFSFNVVEAIFLFSSLCSILSDTA